MQTCVTWAHFFAVSAWCALAISAPAFEKALRDLYPEERQWEDTPVLLGILFWDPIPRMPTIMVMVLALLGRSDLLSTSVNQERLRQVLVVVFVMVLIWGVATFAALWRPLMGGHVQAR